MFPTPPCSSTESACPVLTDPTSAVSQHASFLSSILSLKSLAAPQGLLLSQDLNLQEMVKQTLNKALHNIKLALLPRNTKRNKEENNATSATSAPVFSESATVMQYAVDCIVKLPECWRKAGMGREEVVIKEIDVFSQQLLNHLVEEDWMLEVKYQILKS